MAEIVATRGEERMAAEVDQELRVLLARQHILTAELEAAGVTLDAARANRVLGEPEARQRVTEAQSAYRVLEQAVDEIGSRRIDLQEELTAALNREGRRAVVGKIRGLAARATEHLDAFVQARAEANAMLEQHVHAMVASTDALAGVRREFIQITEYRQDMHAILDELWREGVDLAALLAPWRESGSTPHDRVYKMPEAKPYGGVVGQLWADIVSRRIEQRMLRERLLRGARRRRRR